MAEERGTSSTSEPGRDQRREGGPAEAARQLADALDAHDEPAAQAILDELLSTLTVETVVRDVVLPYLRDLGERWRRGDIGVADEHFASNVIRGRLAGLARGWGTGRGPRALLACMPGELHDMALLAFGVVLYRNGWRVSYLGADTPLDELIRAAQSVRPNLVVVTATTGGRFAGVIAELSRLARLAPLALGGAGATPEIAAAVGAQLLLEDPVTAAEKIAVPEGQRRYGARVLFPRQVLDGIARREVDLAFRSWDRPRVRAGTHLRTAIGVVAVESVAEVDPATITRADAQRAGYAGLAELHTALAKYARGRGRPVYRIELRHAGEDPRIALRQRDELAEDETAALLDRLRRLDRASRRGPWTAQVLRLIADRPAVRAADLAAELGREKLAFKADVRKLKELGLTESLEIGYRLSPRGRAILSKLDD